MFLQKKNSREDSNVNYFIFEIALRDSGTRFSNNWFLI